MKMVQGQSCARAFFEGADENAESLIKKINPAGGGSRPLLLLGKLHPQFLACAFGYSRHFCERSYLNRVSSQALDRELYGVVLTTERLVDDCG